MKYQLVPAVLLAALAATSCALAAEPTPQLAPGKTFTVRFREMPPTYYALDTKEELKAQMSVYLPTNYDPARKHPLLIFLSGGNGGGGGNPEVARALTEGKDFVCANMPLFRANDSTRPATKGLVILTAVDGKYMWPYFKTMLEKLEKLVPNIDPAHRMLGGFSNGAHATAALIDGSEGEVSRRFSAFIFAEGGGKLQHYDLLKGKAVLLFSSNAKSRPRAQEICDTAKAAGALATFTIHDVGGHAFPPAAYPTVREWLRGPALQCSGL